LTLRSFSEDDDLMSVEVLPWSTLVARIGAALLIGGLIGADRRRTGKPAGMRTHMLVSLGSCMLVLVPIDLGGDAAAVSRVVQGIATGVGFLGAGEILYMHVGGTARTKVKGLTSAAAIWFTAALGIAAGCGLWRAYALGTAAIVVILTLIKWLEHLMFPGPRKGQTP
jgi:putative Mg2+ transporter-C (MgtC) family protein